MGAMATVTDESFEAGVLEQAGHVLVDFHAYWCGPCKVMNVVLEQIDAEQDGLRVVGLDTDANPQTIAMFAVRSIPTLLLFRDGRLVRQFIGTMTKPRLEAGLLPEISL